MHVRTVAVRLGLRRAATAQRRRFVLGSILFARLVIPDFAFAVRQHELLFQWRLSVNQIGPFLHNGDMKPVGGHFRARLYIELFHVIDVFKNRLRIFERATIIPVGRKRDKIRVFRCAGTESPQRPPAGRRPGSIATLRSGRTSAKRNRAPGSGKSPVGTTP